MRTPFHHAVRRAPSRAARAGAAAALSLAATLACAGSSTTTFTVSVTVINNCTISSSGLSFGTYDPSSVTGLSARGSVIAKCTKGDAVSVALNQGANPAVGSTPAVPARRMSNAASSYLPYHIYLGDSAGRQEWGKGLLGKNEPLPVIAQGTGTPITFISYGSLPAGSNVPGGYYTDIVTATVTF